MIHVIERIKNGIVPKTDYIKHLIPSSSLRLGWLDSTAWLTFFLRNVICNQVQQGWEMMNAIKTFRFSVWSACCLYIYWPKSFTWLDMHWQQIVVGDWEPMNMILN